MNSPEEQHNGWPRGWEEHRILQERRWARLSFAEKLEWLESAQELAEAILAARKRCLDRQPPPASAASEG